jgi:O-antigen ligase
MKVLPFILIWIHWLYGWTLSLNSTYDLWNYITRALPFPAFVLGGFLVPAMRKSKVLWSMVIITILMILFAFLDKYGIWLVHSRHDGTLKSVFNQRNQFAFFLILSMIPSLLLYLRKESPRWVLMAPIFSGIVLFMTLAKGASIGLLGGFVFWLLSTKYPKKNTLWYVLLALGLGLLTYSVLLLTPNSETIATINERLQMYTAAFSAIASSFPLGTGWGQFEVQFYEFLGEANRLILAKYTVGSAPHNLFLHSWVETGLLGFLVECTLWILPAFMLLRKEPTNESKLLLAVLIAIFPILLLNVVTQIFASSIILYYAFLGYCWIFAMGVPKLNAPLSKIIGLLLALQLLFFSKDGHAAFNYLRSDKIMQPIISSGFFLPNEDFTKVSEALRLTPNHPEALLQQVSIFLDFREHEDAMTILRYLQSEWRSKTFYQVFLGRLYFNEVQYDSAAHYLKTAVRIVNRNQNEDALRLIYSLAELGHCQEFAYYAHPDRPFWLIPGEPPSESAPPNIQLRFKRNTQFINWRDLLKCPITDVERQLIRHQISPATASLFPLVPTAPPPSDSLVP